MNKYLYYYKGIKKIDGKYRIYLIRQLDFYKEDMVESLLIWYKKEKRIGDFVVECICEYDYLFLAEADFETLGVEDFGIDSSVVDSPEKIEEIWR